MWTQEFCVTTDTLRRHHHIANAAERGDSQSRKNRPVLVRRQHESGSSSCLVLTSHQSPPQNCNLSKNRRPTMIRSRALNTKMGTRKLDAWFALDCESSMLFIRHECCPLDLSGRFSRVEASLYFHSTCFAVGRTCNQVYATNTGRDG